jgi:hypothetical protein
MHQVPEFVKHRLHLAMIQKRRFVSHGWRKITRQYGDMLSSRAIVVQPALGRETPRRV